MSMKILFAVLIMLIVAVPASAATWYTYNGHQYCLTSAVDDWNVAEDEAVDLGGNLVTIDNLAESEWLASTFGGYCWIGLYQSEGCGEPDGGWGWVSGEPFTYANWHPGEPNNMGSTVENYEQWALIYGDGTWNDAGSDSHFQGIVEVTPVPEPSSLVALGVGLIPILGAFRRRSRISS